VGARELSNENIRKMFLGFVFGVVDEREDQCLCLFGLWGHGVEIM
jgi:hypothetical protein